MHVLSQVSMFDGLNDEDLILIHRVAVERTTDAGETIFLEDSPGEKFYILLDGIVEVLVANPLNEEKPVSLAKLSSHEVFGEFCLFDNSPRSATARAIGEARYLEFNRSDILDLFDQKPHIGMTVMRNTGKILCARLRDTDMGLRNSLLWIGSR